MPIVVPSVSCHPIDLLTRLPDEVPGRRWLVACTMPRQEKSLARELFHRGVPFYLPLLAKRLSYKRRSTKSYLPLFSGFVFLFANDQERGTALETGRIASILEVPDQSELHRDLLQVETGLRQSGELAVAGTASHNGIAYRADGVAGTAYRDGSNGNHASQLTTEHRLVLSVGFLRQNIMLETNGGNPQSTASQATSAAQRKPMSL